MKLIKIATSFALIAGLIGTASASTLGYLDSGAGYALWGDNFPAITFSDASASSAFGSDFSATLSSSTVAPSYGLVASGDLLYVGSVADGGFNLTLSGTASTDIDTLVIQLKFSTPNVGFGDLGDDTTLDYFTVSSDVGTVTNRFIAGTTTDEAFGTQSYSFNIGVWTFTDLDLSDSDTFTIHIVSAINASGGYHTALDGVRLDAAAVPEPAAFAGLAGLGILALTALRRRQRR